MKRIYFILIGLICLTINAFAKRQVETVLRGTAVEQSGAPAGFATVFLTGADGAVVCGTSADADGRFELKAAPGTYTLTVSLVGFLDATQPVNLEGTLVELSPIRLEEDRMMLGEAVVQAIMPKTTISGEGLATSVRGSVLENAGTARDVLAKVPGLMKGKDGVEVIGKGTPVFYINGRRMNDANELDRLQSHEIQSVEVISNPGAQYDASVRAVVRIRTIKRKGEGFGFDATLTDQQSLQVKGFNDPSVAVNANYRTGGVDIFGGINARRQTNRQTSDLIQETVNSSTFKQDEFLVADAEEREATLTGGVNWQIADNHSVGVKMDWFRMPYLKEHVLMEGDLFLDNALLDHLRTETDGGVGDRMPFSFGTNAYYNGQVGKLGIDLNLDYYGMGSEHWQRSLEDSSIEDADVKTEALTDSKLYAAKLVLSYPVWQGQLQVGTEETFSRLSDDYRISGAAIPASSNRVREDNAAAFVNYAFYLPKVGQISAGLRYEHVNYAYDDLMGDGSFSRKYDNVFPSFSYGNAFGPVQVMASYSARTARPDFSQLSSAIQYDNRYTLQSGNAALQPQTIQSLNLTGIWNYLTFVANYGRTDHPIITWVDLFNEDGVMLLKPRNLDTPHRMLSAFLVAQPTIGVWTPNYTLGVQQSWLNVNVDDHVGKRTISFNDKPIWVAQMNNTFRFKGGWQFEFGGEWHSPGYMQNLMITNHYLDVSAAIQKTLLNDSLVIRLSAMDLAGLGYNNVHTDLTHYRLTQSVKMDFQRVTLSLRYRFNTVESKYKGTGAGKDVKDRMK